MSDLFTLSAQERPSTGKAAARRTRKQDLIPAIVYGTDKEPQSIVLSHKEVTKVLKNDAVYSHILDLNIDNKVEKVVLKAIQRHMFKPKIMHMDFMRIKAKEKINMNIPLTFLNEESCPGVKAGGLVSKLMTEIEIRCLPSDLPETIEVDMSTLDLDHSLHISDLKLPAKTELTIELDDNHNQPVVSIHKPKAIKEIEADDAPADVTEEKPEVAKE